MNKKPLQRIRIASFRDEYFFLSNFFPCMLTVDGKTFPSSEHAYMSYKSDAPEWKKICTDRYIKPGEIKRKSKSLKLIKGWDDKKLAIMKKVVAAKFQQNKNLAQRLLYTGDAELIEGNTWHDRFWGMCDGVGENHLGKILMKVREDISIGLATNESQLK